MDFFFPRVFSILGLIGLILVPLVQIAGIIVSAILIKRKPGIGGALSLIGFTALLLMGICGHVYDRLLYPALIHRGAYRNLTLINTSYQCINGLTMTVGFALLVFGIWQLAQPPKTAIADTAETKDDPSSTEPAD
jgi:hypothetical protein